MKDPLTPSQSAQRPPGSLAELQRRISTYARDHDLAVARLMQRACVEALFGALAVARAEGQELLYVLKGGMALELRFGTAARASKDADLALGVGHGELLPTLERALAVGFDKFRFNIGTVRELDRAQTIRAEVAVTFHDRAFMTLPLDLSAASPDVPIEIVTTSLLTAFALPGPIDVPVIDVYLQLAHKLHGATEPSRDDYVNRRYRDVVDVLILAEQYDLDGARLRAIAIEEFARRPNHTKWPPTFVLPDDWRISVVAEAAAAGLAEKDPDALARRFQQFVAWIEASPR